MDTQSKGANDPPERHPIVSGLMQSRLRSEQRKREMLKETTETFWVKMSDALKMYFQKKTPSQRSRTPRYVSETANTCALACVPQTATEALRHRRE
ncbi:hypothetical protein KUCAC02_026820 [Chaenocephalus aceratus]|nr:hypothetical protein KUCAC02_035360 [Chaenocephalus aceratus]KAI4796693.1 hypothetical protein KUCAC02_026820 [Chaenocephalus aceratus]